VVLNPVRAKKIAKDPRDWRWSAYQATTGHKGIPYLTTDWILSQFSKEQKKASREYQAFVLSGIKTESPLKAVGGR
jgi:hypothetical protein